mgnify:CR=1 FL=1
MLGERSLQDASQVGPHRGLLRDDQRLAHELGEVALPEGVIRPQGSPQTFRPPGDGRQLQLLCHAGCVVDPAYRPSPGSQRLGIVQLVMSDPQRRP